eukprot:Pompholyxophrys_punicea_v1_NODE_270_length_2442_cov_14.718894.p3 type:complete len:114 gc:universal NODE_270_length_2442_cov_14.718894:690-349(-)
MWLMDERNLELWESGSQGLSASDRRILMTIWTDVAVKKVNERYESIWSYFLNTGCLITIDGSKDERILPKYPDYKISRDFETFPCEKQMWPLVMIQKMWLLLIHPQARVRRKN